MSSLYKQYTKERKVIDMDFVNNNTIIECGGFIADSGTTGVALEPTKKKEWKGYDWAKNILVQAHVIPSEVSNIRDKNQ